MCSLNPISFPEASPALWIPHSRLTAGEAEVAAVAAVLRSGQWAGGPVLAEAERELATLFGQRCAVGLGTGLAALRLSLQAIGVGPGDEVIVPAYSCVALANAVLALGARPAPTDVEPCAWNLDPSCAAARLTQRSRAIVAVNTFGRPAPIAGLRGLGLPIVEDASHGFALDGEGRPMLQGDVAVLSCYATKLIASGEGGAVLTADSALAGRLREARDYADKEADGDRLNDKMTDIAAALLCVQLGRLGGFLQRRQALAECYRQRLARVTARAGLVLPDADRGRTWYRFVVRTVGRPAVPLVEALRREGVGAASPVENWASTWCRREGIAGEFPVAERAFAELLSLPLYPTLREDEVERICAVLEAALTEKTG
ncbi:MAG: DegT/DnrJ/EryC1/StrS family aminotransferase [Alphaproteobacteria bacterium]|nr:DegT/DnrJ/EryC1/StrS family aminotransferase [Alphaproteobacteria bacterium]